MIFVPLAVLFPFISFLCLIFNQNFYSKKNVCIIGVFFVFLSFLCSLKIIFFLYFNPHIIKIPLWTWLKYKQFSINFNFVLDRKVSLLISMVTLVGFLVNIFSIWYIRKKDNISKYFAYTNLFITCIEILILSDNLLLMYFSWEAAGFCSYCLIGFYSDNIKNGYSALKAYLLTRFSDFFLLIAIFLIFYKFHNLNFLVLKNIFLKNNFIFKNSFYNNSIALFLLLGAIGKSAQIPFHVWLLDAMVGPTPVSALIHAATMVTVGIYLIMKTFYFFIISPYILNFMTCIGIITLLFSSFTAIFQNSLKKILAYSTISQLGYIFVALGLKNIQVAFLHLFFHSFFKSLLFLSAGSIIKLMNYEQNIFKMRISYKKIKIIYFSFLIGCLSLCSFPFLTSSFYSKEKILYLAWNSKNFCLFFLLLLGIFFTSVYTFRMFLNVFHMNISKKFLFKKNSVFQNIPLIILNILCFSEIYFIVQKFLYPKMFFSEFCFFSFYIMFFSFFVSFLGFFLVYFFYINPKNSFFIFLQIFYQKTIQKIVLKDWYLQFFYEKIFFYIYESCFIKIKKKKLEKFFNIFSYIIFFLNKKFLKIEQKNMFGYFGVLITFLFIIFFICFINSFYLFNRF
ncbi:NADH-quinone oxidoreductase subunit L [Buchnera aphidicola]|uniref:NADH-quinone oxidoreductase subunit L n=1 Tax=Buchnera aphidicola TaxID=9 RepID=UPI0031B6BA6B